MERFADSIAAGLASREFQHHLKHYCLQWRSHPTPYVLDHVVDHLLLDGSTTELFDILMDPEFHQLRNERSGNNALRLDIQKGLKFFSETRPDLLRYLRLHMLQQRVALARNTPPTADPQNCKQYEEFLQLDVPAAERRDSGLHRALTRAFPVQVRVKNPDTRRRFLQKVRLINYEVGEWRCRCARRHGHQLRFDYSCACGALQGNGSLPTSPCGRCEGTAAYIHCLECHTRVTLSLLWRIREGAIHPSELTLPVWVELAIEEQGGRSHHTRRLAFRLPLLLGLGEREDRLVFEPPAAFWCAPTNLTNDLFLADSGFFVFMDTPEYRGRTGLGQVLEEVLVELLTPSTEPFTPNLLDSLGDSQKLTDILTDSHLPIAIPFRSSMDLLGRFELTLSCSVATSHELQGRAIIVNEHISRPGGLGFSSLEIQTVVLHRSEEEPVEFSVQALDGTDRPWLENDGIIRVGERVEPGQVLVGLVKATSKPGNLTPDEKLLAAIFGSNLPAKRDASMVLQGRYAARVVAVHVALNRAAPSPTITARPGRTVTSSSGFREIARISISLAIEHPLSVGDRVSTVDGVEGIVSRIEPPELMRKLAGGQQIPDILVSPKHPWCIEPVYGGLRELELTTRGDRLLVSRVESCGSVHRSLIEDAPLIAPHNPAQRVTVEDMDELLASGAECLARELIGPRADCLGWSMRLAECLLDGPCSLARVAPLLPDGTSWRGELSASASGAVRHLGAVLHVMGIGVFITGGAQPTISFRPVSSKQVLEASRGEVERRGTLDIKTGKPSPKGLFCERIFGPVTDGECRCGRWRQPKRNGFSCKRCEVEHTFSRVRRFRTGHIRIPMPILHPLYGKELLKDLGTRWKLDSRQLREVVHDRKELVLVDERGCPPALFIRTHDPSAEPQTNQRVLRGVAAILQLMELGSARNEHARCAIMSAVEVLPADLRPHFLSRLGLVMTTDINDLYARVAERCARLRRLIVMNAPNSILQSQHNLIQKGVQDLFQNSSIKTMHGRRLVSLKDIAEKGATGRQSRTLMARLLERTVDHSAATYLSVAETPSAETAYVPMSLLWDLLRPLILRKVQQELDCTWKHARQQITDHTPPAKRALAAVCHDSLLLLSIPKAQRRLVAVKPSPWNALGLGVHPTLMNLLHWDALGTRVRIFSILSVEALDEAARHLVPGQLVSSEKLRQALVQTRRSRRDSVLSIPQSRLINTLTRWALDEESFPLSLYDLLTLRMTGGEPDHELMKRFWERPTASSSV